LIIANISSKAEALFEQTHNCGSRRPLLYQWPLAFDLVVDAFRNIEENRILRWFHELFEQTGPTFEQKILGCTSIDTIDPANLESILSTNFSSKISESHGRRRGSASVDQLIIDWHTMAAYGLGARRPTFAPLLGDGIFTQDGAAWKHSRDMLRPLFSINRANIFTQIETHTEHLVNCIPTNDLIDLQPLFFRFTFDTTTFLLFGKSMHSLQATPAQVQADSREARFSEAFRGSQDMLFRRSRLGDMYWLISSKKFRRDYATVHQFVDEAVQEALSAETQDGKVADYHSFLDALFKRHATPKCCVISC
jgi:hypothetical protein